MTYECNKKENNKITLTITLNPEELTMYNCLSGWLKDSFVALEMFETMSDYGFSWSNDILGFTDGNMLVDFYNVVNEFVKDLDIDLGNYCEADCTGDCSKCHEEQ